jgi:two-component system, chemotaxis family, chemotaxis protein CheY
MAASTPRVLIIDDMAGVRESLRAALRGAGFDVATANDGRDGLAALAAETFDIVVTDIWMPQVDGLNVIKRIRAAQPQLRVFAMTGGGPRLTIEAAGSIAEVWGAERVFVKPFDEAALIAAIKAPRG